MVDGRLNSRDKNAFAGRHERVADLFSCQLAARHQVMQAKHLDRAFELHAFDIEFPAANHGHLASMSQDCIAVGQRKLGVFALGDFLHHTGPIERHTCVAEVCFTQLVHPAYVALWRDDAVLHIKLDIVCDGLVTLLHVCIAVVWVNQVLKSDMKSVKTARLQTKQHISLV